MINSGQNDVAIMMNLQLALKISQDEIYQMKFQHIYKEGNNCIITFNNKKELVLNNEHLLSELQLIFKVNIGGKVSNKRNRIIEAFNQTRKFKLNHLGNSENDKQYQQFLQQISLSKYKMMDRSNLRTFTLLDNSLQNLQSQKKDKKEEKLRKHEYTLYDKVFKRTMSGDLIEISNDQKSPIEQIVKLGLQQSE
ncbi:unnamed protein product [Paramecium primaurelia]|nr:unnamed protein product [Paramecium primaurelia]